MKVCIRAIGALALRYGIAILAGLVIFICLHKLHVPGQPTIFFYRSVMLATASAMVLTFSIIMIARRYSIDLATGVGAVVASFSLNICFTVLVPVTIDRSISVFLLARIEQQDGAMTTHDLDTKFRAQYLNDMRQIARRVDEQSRSGNIAVDNSGRIYMTDRGRRFLAFARFVADAFGTDRRFVVPDAAEATGLVKPSQLR